MFPSFEKILANVKIKGTTTMKNINKIEEDMGISLPQDFKVFLEKHNGMEGGIGENSYLQMWSIEDIFLRNRRLQVNDFAPGLVIIGSDGGDMAYAYDTRETAMPIVEAPFIPLKLQEVTFCANDLAGFFEYLYNQ